MLDPLNPFQIQVSPRGYDALFAQMLAAVPPGAGFYDVLLGYPIVNWSRRAPVFVLQTDQTGVPIKVTALRKGGYPQGIDQGNLIAVAYFVPNQQNTSFQLTMGIGLNRLIATELIPNGRTTILDVMSTPNTMLFEAFGREISNSTDAVQAQQDALFSPYSTRMLDQVVTFQDLLPDVQSMKVLSMKMLVRSRVHFPSRVIGTQDFIQAFMLNTPVMVQMRQPTDFQIERSIIRRTQENSAGQEAHVWVPNLSVTQWLAFIKMADSMRQNYVINSVQDDLVGITYKGLNQLHQFDYDAPGSDFLPNLTQTNCFGNIEYSMGSVILSNFKFPMWSYTFDYLVTAQSPIGRARVMFDEDVPFDSDLPFDSDPVDPFNDGWVGWSLSGRFEQNVPSALDAVLGLDSSVAPALSYGGSATVYTHGPYTQMFNSHNIEIDVEEEMTITGSQDTYTPGAITHLELDLPLNQPILTAGTAYPVVLKYADANDMTVPTGAGSVTVQESSGGTTEIEAVTGGYKQFNLTPTKAGQIHWSLHDGTYSNVSDIVTVVAGPFASFVFANISNQTVGVPFSFSIQAADQYGNPITDVGDDVKVNILIDGFPPDSIVPDYIELVNGAATVELTFNEAGTGQLDFQLDTVNQLSNIFSAS
jgi:hypothetical protein